jgi:hypothetical protein
VKAFTQRSVADGPNNAIGLRESVCQPLKVSQSACLQVGVIGPTLEEICGSAIDINDLEAATDGNRLHRSDARRSAEVHAFVIGNQIDVAA